MRRRVDLRGSRTGQTQTTDRPRSFFAQLAKYFHIFFFSPCLHIVHIQLVYIYIYSTLRLFFVFTRILRDRNKRPRANFTLKHLVVVVSFFFLCVFRLCRPCRACPTSGHENGTGTITLCFRY